MNTKALEVIESRPRRNTAATVVPSGEATPMQLLQIATQQGRSIEEIEKFMALAERWEANQARKAFAVALAEFKKKAPAIIKSTHVKYKNRSGDFTEYDHESLDAVCAAAIPGLAAVGISHNWVVRQADGRVYVRCVLTHVEGHREIGEEMFAAPDDSGGKNSIQAIKSTVSYFERITLLAAAGLAAKGMDDDGRTGGQPPREEPRPGKPETRAPRAIAGAGKVNAGQLRILQKKLDDSGVPEADFLLRFDIGAVTELPFARLQDALKWLHEINAPPEE